MKVVFIEERENGKKYGYALSTKCRSEQELNELLANIIEPASKIVHMEIK